MSYNVIGLKEPTPTLIKHVGIKNKENLIKGLIKMLIKVASGDFCGAANSLIDDLVNEIGLSTPEEEKEIASRLICRVMSSKTILNLISDNGISNFSLNEDELSRIIREKISDNNLYIDRDFFDITEQSQIVKDLQICMEQWLVSAGMDKEEIAKFLPSFKGSFINALNKEWQNKPDEYKVLKNHLCAEFSDSLHRIDDWKDYSDWLKDQVDEEVYGHRLSDLYIPLAAYYEEFIEIEGNTKIVVDLEDHLEEWLSAKDKNNTIRVISGEPGSGKSSFAKVFCSKQAKKHKVLFIPLYCFNLNNGIAKGIMEILHGEKAFKSYNDDSFFNSDDEFLIVFDGLDELRGESCQKTSGQFIESVNDFLKIKNRRRLTINVLITGRNLSVKTNEIIIKRNGQILYVLPYFVIGDERKEYTDNKNLLGEDKRCIFRSDRAICTAI